MKFATLIIAIDSGDLVSALDSYIYTKVPQYQTRAGHFTTAKKVSSNHLLSVTDAHLCANHHIRRFGSIASLACSHSSFKGLITTPRGNGPLRSTASSNSLSRSQRVATFWRTRFVCITCRTVAHVGRCCAGRGTEASRFSEETTGVIGTGHVHVGRNGEVDSAKPHTLGPESYTLNRTTSRTAALL